MGRGLPIMESTNKNVRAGTGRAWHNTARVRVWILIGPPLSKKQSTQSHKMIWIKASTKWHSLKVHNGLCVADLTQP